MNNAFGQKTPPPRAASTVHFDLFDEGDVLAARPTPLVEVRPQLGVQRHSAEQVIETFVPVQVLDAPVPQVGVVQVVEFMRKFDAPVVAEPVIEVPKILLDRIPQRLGDRLRQLQMVEQLVHVPTVVSYSSLQQLTAEQIVDLPVSGAGGGGRGGLQGFLPRQNSAALHVEQTVDIPVPGRAGGVGRGGLQGFSGQGSTASSGADRVDIPVPRSGGLQGSRPGQGSSSLSRLLENTDAGIQGVFRTFPRGKKCGVWFALGVGTGCGLYSMDSGGLCRVHGHRRRRGGVGGGGGRGRSDSLCSWLSAFAGLHAVPRTPDGAASVGVCLRRQVHLRTLMG